MTDTKNPYIEPHDYYDGYNESIEKNKNNPEAVAFEKLCYEVWTQTDNGKDLMKRLEDMFFFRQLASPEMANYSTACVHVEGVRDLIRMFRNCSLSHLQRINAGAKKND